MDPTTTPNQFQLAFIDLGFALWDLFWNVVLGVVFPAVTTPFLTNVFDVLRQIFSPLLPA
ncbi:MAG: hypothetical protein KF841_01035 [Phycisphaerae bacterium]|nr:hypothetical protein [Phycisphaerae bacterium]